MMHSGADQVCLRMLQTKSSQSHEAETKIQHGEQWSSNNEFLNADSLFKNGTLQSKVMGISESVFPWQQ